MANLKIAEKARLQKFLEMNGGYVCDFTNGSFADFVAEVVEVAIYSDEYAENNSGSKASRLRAFWDKESDQIVAKLLDELIDYWKLQLVIGVTGYEPFNQSLFDECKNIVKRLKAYQSIDDADALVPNSSDRDFGLLAKSITESIQKGEIEQSLDRLHTFVVRYLRTLSSERGLVYDKNTPLNALIGGYIKSLRDNSLIDSEMTMRILKSSIQILESFDGVRNNQSLAHDNPILNRDESLLIFRYVSSTIRFLESMERRILEQSKKKKESQEKYEVDLDTALYDQAMEAQAFDQYVQEEIDRRLGK